MRQKKVKQFATEAELCAAFLADVGEGWTPYAETAGWDILLVRNSDGLQIGIEAKLRLGVDVVNQALEEYGIWSATRPAPDCRAVLVPDCEGGGFDRIANYIGFTILRMRRQHPGARGGQKFSPNLPQEQGDWSWKHWHEWAPAKRHKLPAYVPDVMAGASAPIQLTEWKIGAIKIAIVLERRGFVTREDFKAAGIDHRRWFARETQWLSVVDGRRVAGPGFPNVKVQHPRVYDEIAADADKWMVKTPIPQQVGVLL